jgi:hypothetical protein
MSQPFRLKTYMWPLIGYLTRTGRPKLVAQALRAITTKLDLPSAKSQRGNPGRRLLVLSIDKAGVREDIEEVFADAVDYEIVIWPSYALRAISGVLLAPGLSHDRYLTEDPAVEASKLRYRQFLRTVWRHLTTGYPIDAVIGVNFGYYVQREFAAALQESGTPFIVLQKENLNGMTQRRADYWRTAYAKGRGKFTGRKILVYNDIERDLEISSGIVEPQNVAVTGMPRLDHIHRWRGDHAGQVLARPQVLFFGFSRKDKVPGRNIEKLKAKGLRTTGASLEQAGDQWKDLSWDELVTGTCRGIVAFARSRPDVQVVVKTKGQTSQADETTELLKGGGDLPSNVTIVKGGDPFELITQSSVVVGFNTTGLIEAVAAGKPVVVPWFGEVHNETMRDLILDLGEAVEYARSPEELADKTAAQIAAGATIPSALSENAKVMLRRLVGNDDGAASARVRQAISAEMQQALR